jgi:hypothetical protein
MTAQLKALNVEAGRLATEYLQEQQLRQPHHCFALPNRKMPADH